ncbi:MAG TPA: nucleotide exchange factor GrpE [Gemmatimonadales bacterium]|nr:nucleotide exchange factor GrpE [Gemmatimonadales bacterium]
MAKHKTHGVQQKTEQSHPVAEAATAAEAPAKPEPDEAGSLEHGSEVGTTGADLDQAGAGSSAEGASAVLAEPTESALHRTQDELAELKDRHLRLHAEFDNYKKRVQRERVEMFARAQAQVVAGILDVLDDLARVAHLDPERTSGADVLAGVELVERKLLKGLETAGLERVGEAGVPFDPNLHEAVTTVPAPVADQDHTVAQVFQAGYRFAGALLRPARVSVYVWQQPSTDGGEAA